MIDTRPSSGDLLRRSMRLLRPHHLLGSTKIRLGRYYDGGYVMLDRMDRYSAAYSLGISDDVSWDLDVASRSVPLHQYDPTISKLPEEHELFNFKPLRIAGQTDIEAGSVTLQHLVAENGHTGETGLLLKCDIEGSEWDLLKNIPSKILSQFEQIVIELHNIGLVASDQHGNMARRALINLTANHNVVHVHANNYALWQVVGGVVVPAVLELTLVRKDAGAFEVSNEVFPTPLDMPCKKDVADYYLSTFTF